MRKFEIGDIVECVEAFSTHLKIGDIFIIKSISLDDMIRVVPYDEGNQMAGTWFKSRFILRLDLMREDKLNQLLK